MYRKHNTGPSWEQLVVWGLPHCIGLGGWEHLQHPLIFMAMVDSWFHLLGLVATTCMSQKLPWVIPSRKLGHQFLFESNLMWLKAQWPRYHMWPSLVMDHALLFLGSLLKHILLNYCFWNLEALPLSIAVKERSLQPTRNINQPGISFLEI